MLLPCSPRSQACADCVGAVRVSALGLRKKRTARELALGRVPRSCTANRWNAATGNPTCGDKPGLDRNELPDKALNFTLHFAGGIAT